MPFLILLSWVLSTSVYISFCDRSNFCVGCSEFDLVRLDAVLVGSVVRIHVAVDGTTPSLLAWAKRLRRLLAGSKWVAPMETVDFSVRMGLFHVLVRLNYTILDVLLCPIIMLFQRAWGEIVSVFFDGNETWCWNPILHAHGEEKISSEGSVDIYFNCIPDGLVWMQVLLLVHWRWRSRPDTVIRRAMLEM